MILSIPMMIKNEEKHLRECLESLRPLLDELEAELIIVDTGSSDQSLSIAGEFTDKIFHHEWNDHFADMRNLTLSYASGEWILIIDGDEFLSDATAILSFFQTGKHRTCQAASLTITNFQNSELTDTSSFSAIRLFQNRPENRYEGAVHNQLSVTGQFIHLDGTLYHYGYIRDDKALMEKKFARTASILKAELDSNPDNLYYRYQLAVSYAMYEDFASSLRESEIAFRQLQASDYDRKTYIYVYNQYIKDLIHAGRTEDALAVAEEAAQLDTQNVDVHIWMAKLYGQKGDRERAKANYLRYLELNAFYQRSANKNTNLILYTLGKERIAYLDLFQIAVEDGNWADAIAYGDKIEDWSFHITHTKEVTTAYEKLNKPDGFTSWMKRCLSPLNPEQTEGFLMACEQSLTNTSAAFRHSVARGMSLGDDPYAYLNRLRVLFSERKVEHFYQVLLGMQEKHDLNRTPDYFGDIIYEILSFQLVETGIFAHLSEKNIRSYLEYCHATYMDFPSVCNAFLRKQKDDSSLDCIKAMKNLAVFLYINSAPSSSDRNTWFDIFLAYGLQYMRYLYTPAFLDGFFANDCKNDEEVFLLHMLAYQREKETTPSAAIRSLHQALVVLPIFHEAIEKLSHQINSQQQIPQEMQRLIEQMKKNIAVLIESGHTTEAKLLLDEMCSYVEPDQETVTLRTMLSNSHDYPLQ